MRPFFVGDRWLLNAHPVRGPYMLNPDRDAEKGLLMPRAGAILCMVEAIGTVPATVPSPSVVADVGATVGATTT